MSWEAWLTLAVVAVTIAALIAEVTEPSAVVFGAVVVLLLSDVIDVGQAFSGFANPAPITVAALYVVAGGVERTGILNRVVDVVLGDRGAGRTMGRMLLPTAGASALLSNTPIVAMLSPAVSRWAVRNDRSVSALLMPLSYAAILGGMVTVIGTSTNVVVSGLLVDAGMEPLGFFEPAKLGLPVAVGGLLGLLGLTGVLLPKRRAARRDIEDVREFVVEMTVDPGGELDGATVESGGLRHLAGLFLAQVERTQHVIAPVSPDTVLDGDDILRFVGNSTEVADLRQMRGLTPKADEHVRVLPTTGGLAFFEAVIGASSPLVGNSLKSSGFRERYQAAVLAVHRADQRIEGKLGELRLRNGDTLLLQAAQPFGPRWQGSPDFLVVSRLDTATPPRRRKVVPASLIGLGVVLAAALGILSIVEASLLGASAVILFGVLSPAEARATIDLNVVMVIAASFGLATAVRETGLADRLANGLLDALSGLGSIGVLLGVVVATLALTELITNNAAAVLVFPIAISAAAGVGADPRGFALAVALGASASFLTPIGYQTNTMVWGPGGYRFTDYARLGFPMTFLTIATIAVLVPVYWTV